MIASALFPILPSIPGVDMLCSVGGCEVPVARGLPARTHKLCAHHEEAWQASEHRRNWRNTIRDDAFHHRADHRLWLAEWRATVDRKPDNAVNPYATPFAYN